MSHSVLMLVWKGPSKIIYSNLPCLRKGHLSLDQVTQNLPLNTLNDVASIHSFSGQPVPVSYHPRCPIFLPNVQSKSTLLLFKTFVACLITTSIGIKSFSSLSYNLFSFIYSTQSLLFSRLFLRPDLSVCYDRRGAPALCSSSPTSSRPALRGPHLSYAEDPRAVCSTPGGIYQVQSSGADSTPCPAGHAALDAKIGHGWLSGL